MRMPAVAGRFYSADEDEVREDIEQCFRMGPGMPGPRRDSRSTVAVVAPHAGYMFSGPCAAFSFKALAEEPRPEAYIVIGPDHCGNGCALSMCTDEYWTPFGECETAWDLAMELQDDVPDIPSAHSREHSVEVELPFLKYIDPDARILPLVMGDQSRAAAERLSSLLSPICEEHDVAVIASSDLVHYLPKPEADELDSMFLSCVESLDVDSMYRCIRSERMTVCGYGPIAAAIGCTRPTSCEVLCRTDSSASGLGSDSVVGYGAVRFLRRWKMPGDAPGGVFNRRSS